MGEMLTVDQVAELLRCAPSTIRERCRAGDLPGEKFGEDWILPTRALIERVNEIAVEKMLERRKKDAPNLVSVGGGGTGKRQPPSLSVVG